MAEQSQTAKSWETVRCCYFRPVSVLALEQLCSSKYLKHGHTLKVSTKCHRLSEAHSQASQSCAPKSEIPGWQRSQAPVYELRAASFMIFPHLKVCRILFPQIVINPGPSAVNILSPNHWMQGNSHSQSVFLIWSAALILRGKIKFTPLHTSQDFDV